MEKKDKKNEQKKWKRQKNLGRSESGREVHCTEKSYVFYQHPSIAHCSPAGLLVSTHIQIRKHTRPTKAMNVCVCFCANCVIVINVPALINGEY